MSALRSPAAATSQLSQRSVLCELKDLGETTLWASARFPYANVNGDGHARLISSATGETLLDTRFAEQGWHLRGEVDPAVHPVLRVRRDVRISPVVELLLGTTALVHSQNGEVFVSPPAWRVDASGIGLLSGGEARVGCEDISLQRWIRAEPRWRTSAQLRQGKLIYVLEKPSGLLAATLIVREARGVRTHQREGDLVRITYRTDGLLLAGWVRRDDLWESGSPPSVSRLSLSGTSRETSLRCSSSVPLSVSAVTRHSRELVGRVSATTPFWFVAEYDTELAIRPIGIDVQLRADVELRVSAGIDSLDCS